MFHSIYPHFFVIDEVFKFNVLCNSGIRARRTKKRKIKEAKRATDDCVAKKPLKSKKASPTNSSIDEGEAFI